VEKAIKEMTDMKATGDDNVPGDVLKLLRDNDRKLTKQLINNIYETGEWPKDFNHVTIITLKKKPKATTCSDHCTISLNAHTGNTIARTLRRIERKIDYVLGEDQFGFRTGRGVPDVTGMLRIMSE
jgi:hypothetical protein